MGGRTLAETARKIGASRRDLTRFLCRARGSKGKTEELTPQERDDLRKSAECSKSKR